MADELKPMTLRELGPQIRSLIEQAREGGTQEHWLSRRLSEIYDEALLPRTPASAPDEGEGAE